MQEERKGVGVRMFKYPRILMPGEGINVGEITLLCEVYILPKLWDSVCAHEQNPRFTFYNLFLSQ